MLQNVPVGLIEENAARVGFSNDPQLEESLSVHGQLSPIMLRRHPFSPDKFCVIFGNRRLISAKKLGWATILADVVEASDEEALTLAFAENVDRSDFSDYEKALLIERIRSVTGKNYLQIAEMIGRSPAYVAQHVGMLRLFSENISIEERAKTTNALSERHARILLRIQDIHERWNVAKRVVDGKLSLRELGRFCSRPSHRCPQRNTSKVKESILEIISKAFSGLNSGDLRPIISAWSKDYTLFDNFPPFTMMNLHQAKEQLFQVVRNTNIKLRLKSFNIKVFGNTALVTALVSGSMNCNTGKIDVTCRGSIFFLNEKQWKIFHEHWSMVQPEVVPELVVLEKSRSRDKIL